MFKSKKWLDNALLNLQNEMDSDILVNTNIEKNNEDLLHLHLTRMLKLMNEPAY